MCHQVIGPSNNQAGVAHTVSPAVTVQQPVAVSSPSRPSASPARATAPPATMLSKPTTRHDQKEFEKQEEKKKEEERKRSLFFLVSFSILRFLCTTFYSFFSCNTQCTML